MFTILSPRQKAQQVNQDKGIYGTFAEIGAGKRWQGIFSRQAVHPGQLLRRSPLMT